MDEFYMDDVLFFYLLMYLFICEFIYFLWVVVVFKCLCFGL